METLNEFDITQAFSLNETPARRQVQTAIAPAQAPSFAYLNLRDMGRQVMYHKHAEIQARHPLSVPHRRLPPP
jgi:hypothetical protein